MPIPPDHVLYGPVAAQSYVAAKDALIADVRDAFTPPAAAADARVMQAFQKLKRRFIKLFLSTELLLDEEPALFHMDFKGAAYLGADGMHKIAIEAPSTIVTERLLRLDALDRRAIANRLIGREHGICTMALQRDDDMALPDDVRPTVERQVQLLAELYEHVLAGTAWRTSEPHAG